MRRVCPVVLLLSAMLSGSGCAYSMISRHELRMEPFERIDCWHLKRDMIIRATGDVPVCKQDVKGEHIMGNVLKEDIKAVWERSKEYYLVT